MYVIIFSLNTYYAMLCCFLLALARAFSQHVLQPKDPQGLCQWSPELGITTPRVTCLFALHRGPEWTVPKTVHMLHSLILRRTSPYLISSAMDQNMLFQHKRARETRIMLGFMNLLLVLWSCAGFMLMNQLFDDDQWKIQALMHHAQFNHWQLLINQPCYQFWY